MKALTRARAAEQLSVASIRWQECRERVLVLREQRSALLCERAEPVSREDIAEACEEQRRDPLARVQFPEPTQQAPCWKDWQDGVEDRYLLDEVEWCASCRQRQSVNELLKAETRRHGALMRGLHRLARNRAPLFAAEVS